MLVENPVKENDIITAKLVTGEEIVAKVVKLNDHTISIKKPLQISLMADPNSGQPAVAPMPWVLGAPDDVTLKIGRDKIIFMTQARSEMVNSYTRATTGLDVAANNADILKGMGR